MYSLVIIFQISINVIWFNLKVSYSLLFLSYFYYNLLIFIG